MNRYFYFRDVADEINDDDNSSSIMMPIENIMGIYPQSITLLNVFYKSVKNEMSNDYVQLTVTRGKIKQVIAALVSAMNAGPHHDGVTVVADVCATTNGATSIQGNDVAVPTRFLHPDITGVTINAS
tara:strand:- start:46 stop:426 length:381 start_codon:yes stop_codon:yes gene_type:complete